MGSNLRVIKMILTNLVLVLLCTLACYFAGCCELHVSPKSNCSGIVQSESPYDILDQLVDLSSQQWKMGQYLRAILTLEHACGFVVAYDISEEGGVDSRIEGRICELYQNENYAVLAKILDSYYYFPQASSWVLRSSNKYVSSKESSHANFEGHYREMRRDLAKSASKFADILRVKQGSIDEDSD